jgi:adenine-specific DNA-methyltransferase
MGAGITYMGTKRALASAVSDVIRHAQAGTMLDAFSGMCSVGEAVGSTRTVWNNDIQVFASEVARALFVSRDQPLSPLSCGDIHFSIFDSQRSRLTETFKRSLAIEHDLLASSTFGVFKRLGDRLAKTLGNEVRRCTLKSPHLFSTTYSGTYFGVAQAIDIDSIVAAIRRATLNKALSKDEARWCVIALGRTLLKVANSTGHFAQYLTPKPETYRRYIRGRRRSVWEEWLNSLATLSPVGDERWRARNRAFNEDSLSLVPRLARSKSKLSVIYADPPYTDDQYSRFYHLLETLCLYDYPEAHGIGLYRPGRFQTPFSLKAKAGAALCKLIEASARTGADLVLSYPANGLARKAGLDVRDELRKHFKRVELCRSMAHKHSTFGASKGLAQAETTELIYLARSA